MRWRRLLAVLFGFSGLFFAGSFAFFPNWGQHTSERLVHIACIAVAASAALVSVATWRGRWWALIALRAISAAIVLCVFALAGQEVARQLRLPYRDFQMLYQVLILMGSLTVGPGFVLAMLYHPDVARGFAKRRDSEP
jgi:hypothetical protein